jgi:uncharacterized membrane protein YagU involved in acid resistance
MGRTNDTAAVVRRAAAGSAAGFAATLPMSVAMELMHRRLPPQERYPLPPRQITASVAESAGLEPHLDEPQKFTLTLLAHFGYGAAAGALYAPLAGRSPLPAPLAGVIFGLVVWTTSYLGWLPAARILRPATEHPWRRNALMIAAHVVWGLSAALLVTALSRGRRS